MKKLSMKELTAARRRQTGSARAFTLTELLVVVAVTAMLAAVLLSAAFTTQERVLRAQCVSNLRQIGVGMNLYSAEADGYVPICGWANGQNPWQASEACRVVPGTGNVNRGFYSLGLLFRTKAVADAKIFYCPATSRMLGIHSYDYYATASNGWPSTPVGSGDDNVRVGYDYYPQLRATERVFGSLYILPKLTYATVRLEFGSPLSLMAPAKLTEVNPQKSITTDTIALGIPGLSHRASGAIAGLNALFPDGRVVFQNARTGSSKRNTSWDPNWWLAVNDGVTSDMSQYFRALMNSWNP
jgi:prepilin-type N-terminal cleavage/methylation domain-containing protein